MLTRDDYEQYRRSLDAVAEQANRELGRLWRGLDLSEHEAVRDALLDMLPVIVGAYGDETSALAASFYESLRADSVNSAFLAELAEFNRLAELEKSIRAQINPLFKDGNAGLALKKIEAVVAREVLSMAGDTIALNAKKEKPNVKCASIPSLGCTCTHCLYFASLGFGYTYRDRARKRSGVWHDNCRCQMVPGFGKDPRLDWYDPKRYARLHDYIKSGAISFEKGARPYEKELDIAIFLANAGHVIHFLYPTNRGRTADVEVDGATREFKIPEGSGGSVGILNAYNQFREAQRSGLQSDKLIISEHKIAHLLEAERSYLDEVKNYWKEWPMFTEVWFIEGSGEVVYLTK